MTLVNEPNRKTPCSDSLKDSTQKKPSSKKAIERSNLRTIEPYKLDPLFTIFGE